MGLQECGDKPGAGTGQHGQHKTKERMPRHCGGSRHGTAKGERAIGGHIGNIQHTEAQKQCHGHKGVNKAQLQCTLHNGKGKHKRCSFACKNNKGNTA